MFVSDIFYGNFPIGWKFFGTILVRFDQCLSWMFCYFWKA